MSRTALIRLPPAHALQGCSSSLPRSPHHCTPSMQGGCHHATPQHNRVAVCKKHNLCPSVGPPPFHPAPLRPQPMQRRRLRLPRDASKKCVNLAPSRSTNLHQVHENGWVIFQASDRLFFASSCLCALGFFIGTNAIHFR